MHSHAMSRRWLLVATASIGLSALFAILLVVARTPLLQQLFDGADLFHTVLVLHVNFSVLVWLLAFGALLWSLEGGPMHPLLDPIAFILVIVGALLLSLSPLLTPPPQPVMSNYIPVLHSPAFLTGLCSFAGGIGLSALRRLRYSWQGAGALAAVVLLSVLSLVVITAWRMPGATVAPGDFEALFWGAGHLLQFVYLLLSLLCWQHLLKREGVDVELSRGLAPLVGLICITGLVLALLIEPTAEKSRYAFTQLMRVGTPLLMALPLWRLWRHRAVTPLGLRLSLLLLLLGMLLGVTIRSDNVMVTAHYHATNAAITIAFMTLAYSISTELGLGRVKSQWARRQTQLYFSGMVIYIAGMALSGLLEVPRKVALHAEGAQAFALGLMGLGGLVAISATIFFVVQQLQAARTTRCTGVRHGRGHGTAS